MRSFVQVEEVGKKLNWDRKWEQKGFNILEKLLGEQITSCIWEKNYMKHSVENKTLQINQVFLVDWQSLVDQAFTELLLSV